MATEATSPTVTKALNLRDIPLPLYTQIKTSAAAANMGVRDFVVSLLEAHMQGQCEGRATVNVVISAAPSSPVAPAGQTSTTAVPVAHRPPGQERPGHEEVIPSNTRPPGGPLLVAAREYNSFCPITSQFPAHII